MTIKIIVSLLLASILTLLIIYLLKGKKNQVHSDSSIRGESYRDCPLCGTPLQRGETVHSHLYPGKPDGMMYIYGCPFCYKDHPRVKFKKELVRICPYCKKDIPADGWVVARVFEKPEKTHVHVLGCTECRKVK